MEMQVVQQLFGFGFFDTKTKSRQQLWAQSAVSQQAHQKQEQQQPKQQQQQQPKKQQQQQ
ncbi:TPA: hypothetical protein ACH3X2_002278 [Trebouxia sp. C0005]